MWNYSFQLGSLSKQSIRRKWDIKTKKEKSEIGKKAIKKKQGKCKWKKERSESDSRQKQKKYAIF